MKDIVAALEEIEKSAKSGDRIKIEKATQSARSSITAMHPGGALPGWAEQLENELSVWQTKLSVILKEPAGREGMVKHAKHWIEKLKVQKVK